MYVPSKTGSRFSISYNLQGGYSALQVFSYSTLSSRGSEAIRGIYALSILQHKQFMRRSFDSLRSLRMTYLLAFTLDPHPAETFGVSPLQGTFFHCHLRLRNTAKHFYLIRCVFSFYGRVFLHEKRIFMPLC